MERDTQQLICLLLGEIEHADAVALEQRLSADADLRAQRDKLARSLQMLRAVPRDDAPEHTIDRLMERAREFHAAPEAAHVARVYTLRSVWSVLPRVAAAAVLALLVGLTITYLPDGPQPSVGTVADMQGIKRTIVDGELVEAPIGSPVLIRTTTGEILLDGGGALRLRRSGAQAVVQLDRGRAVVSADRAPATLHAGNHLLTVDSGAVLALDYDREHARVLRGGEVVEVQRTTISDVVDLGREAYGLDLDAADLPEAVLRQRVSFFGTRLDGADFLRSFMQAAADFGVRADGTRLKYEAGTTLRVDEAEGGEVLSLDLLAGSARVAGEEAVRLDTRSGATSLSLTPTRRIERTQSNANRAFVWARGLGNVVVDAKLSDVLPGEGTLPAGTVIYSDRLILPEGEERIFVLDGPDANFPLPGGQRGRLIGLMSSGAEFQLEGTVTRVFVPHSRVISRD